METHEDFITKLDELNSLYVESKQAIILLENLNPEDKTYEAPLNEMRNALDHIMKMVSEKDNPDQIHEQYRGARSHIRRAGYDAYELLCISYSNYIKDSLTGYSSEDISRGFPQYYSEIRPKIEDLKVEIAKLRATREQRNQQQNEAIDGVVVNADESTYISITLKRMNKCPVTVKR